MSVNGAEWTYRCRECSWEGVLGAERLDLEEHIRRERGMGEFGPIKKKFGCPECHFPVVRQFPVNVRTRVKKVTAR